MRSKLVNPGVVNLVLPAKKAASKACRKLLALPDSPERVADMIQKLSSIIFKDEEKRFIRYEWILLILEKIFENEPFSDDLNELICASVEEATQSDPDKKQPASTYRPDIKAKESEDFSDLYISDFDNLFDKAEGQIVDQKEYLSVLQEVCADFLESVQVLLDLNLAKKNGEDTIISFDGNDISFSKFMDQFINGDLLDKFSIEDLVGMLTSLPPGVLEKLNLQLDKVFLQSMMRRKFYKVSLQRYLGRISYYKNNETNNLYFKDKLEDYHTLAKAVNEKISKNETNTSAMLDLKESIEVYLSAVKNGIDNDSAKDSALSAIKPTEPSTFSKIGQDIAKKSNKVSSDVQ